MERLARGWRIVATGTAFAVFGLAGVAFGIFLFPFLKWSARDPRQGEFRVQRVVHRMFRAFVRFMWILGLVEVSVRGEELLCEPGARLIVANHPTLLDVVMLGSLLPQLDCVVKKWATSCWRPASIACARAARSCCSRKAPAPPRGGWGRSGAGRLMRRCAAGLRWSRSSSAASHPR
jgi:hypothetical protein